jgi:small subunit ribosomal protein S19
MTRSLYKPDYISNDIYRKLKKKTSEMLEPLVIKTRDRNTIINSDMLGVEFEIYNGKNLNKLSISHPEMIGHKLGEFIFTKRMGSFLHKQAHAERVRKKKQKLLAQKQSKKKAKTRTKKK